MLDDTFRLYAQPKSGVQHNSGSVGTCKTGASGATANARARQEQETNDFDDNMEVDDKDGKTG